MKIYNRHERKIQAPAAEVGATLDTLSGPADQLWPKDNWPPMQFDTSLREGARGGHGPVRYSSGRGQGRSWPRAVQRDGVSAGPPGRFPV